MASALSRGFGKIVAVFFKQMKKTGLLRRTCKESIEESAWSERQINVSVALHGGNT